jgi:hypothetical protein
MEFEDLLIMYELGMTLKEAVVAHLRHCPRIILEGVRETTRIFSQDSRLSSRESNLEPPPPTNTNESKPIDVNVT